MKKQEFFERYIIFRLPENRLNNAYEKTQTTISLDDWREMRIILFGMAIKKLPSKYRMIIKRIYYDDMKEKNIARELNISQPRVSQIHARAIQLLKNNSLLRLLIK